MLGVAVGLMFFFSRKGWLGDGRRPRADASAENEDAP
jgi:hypothetical protein